MNPIAGIVSGLFVGFLSDAIFNKVPRVAVILVFNVPQAICMGLSIFLSDNIAVFAITNLFTSFANGVIYTLTPAMISEFYGMKYFSRNLWGIYARRRLWWLGFVGNIWSTPIEVAFLIQIPLTVMDYSVSPGVSFY